jgi:hypothetical protein
LKEMNVLISFLFVFGIAAAEDQLGCSPDKETCANELVEEVSLLQSNAQVHISNKLQDSGASASSNKAAHFVNITANGTLALNTTANGTAGLNGTRIFKPSCAVACDSCFAEHWMTCYAVCYKGLQAYCKTQCSEPCDPLWVATPGSGANGIDKKFCDGTTDFDGCPTQVSWAPHR